MPVADIDDRVEQPLISLGRELPTDSGHSIDNLFVSKNGYPVLVEAKLWRNPQSRREVVAQALDYAAQLRSWKYADLDSAARARHGGTPLATLAGAAGLEEAVFVDRVATNLARGRIAILIVRCASTSLATDADSSCQRRSREPSRLSAHAS